MPVRRARIVAARHLAVSWLIERAAVQRTIKSYVQVLRCHTDVQLHIVGEEPKRLSL